MRSKTPLAIPAAALTILATLVPTAAAAQPAQAGPKGPSDPAYTARDTKNMIDAYGRVTQAQLGDPRYLPALVAAGAAQNTRQLLDQAATPNRLALTAGLLVPGWNVGNPYRRGWNGTRGQEKAVAFTNRYGALLRGHVYRPLPGARDPYTGKRLHGPFPGVVITPGSVQGSEGMYEWLAQDLAERGYVVLTYDVQGQGTSETLPHDGGPADAIPFCDLFATPVAGEQTSCPGVPFQQLANFVVGTEDAVSFLTSSPAKPYANPHGSDAPVSAYNPFHAAFDRSRDTRTVTKGRTTRVAIIGHSMGAAAVSKVQGTDKRVETVVALDKLVGPSQTSGALDGSGNVPKVPALALQSEYGFTVTPWALSGGSGLTPGPSPQGPDPRREKRTGFDDWAKAGKDTMLVVPRSSTHLEYTDVPLVLPASRYGQDLSSAYVQMWLDRYLKHRDNTAQLLGGTLHYLEPTATGGRRAVTLHRDRHLSFYYCSAYSLKGHHDGDVTGVGC